MENNIWASDFNAVIPLGLRPYVAVDSITLPAAARPIVDAFGTALSCLEDRVAFRRRLHVLIGVSPFSVGLRNGILNFSPRSEVIGIALDDWAIMLDVSKMINYPSQLCVACILEEFVHAAMGVTNEDIASRIVAALYPEVVLVEGQYTLRKTTP